jgi:hypothetical protein
MVRVLLGRFAWPSTAWPRWLREEVATIARWWMCSLDDLRDHTPLGRSGYEGEDLDNAEAIGSDQRTVGVDSDLSETSPSPLRFLALLFATLRDGLVT